MFLANNDSLSYMFNTMATEFDDLAPCIARASSATVLT